MLFKGVTSADELHQELESGDVRGRVMIFACPVVISGFYLSIKTHDHAHSFIDTHSPGNCASILVKNKIL